MSTQGTGSSQWLERYAHFCGFDWGRERHTIVVVDRDGRKVLSEQFDNDPEGWARFRRLIEPLERLAVTIETSSGSIVENLLEAGCEVYPVTPSASKAFRMRKRPAGCKDDEFDGFSMGDAMRTDGHGWRQLSRDDPRTVELRLTCRDEIALIEQRTALINQLRQALVEYFPTALKAFDDWTMPASWEFVAQFPTPGDLLAKGRRRWEKFLHAHGLARPETYQKRLTTFAGAKELEASAATTAAKSRLALAIVAQLRTLEQQLRDYRARIEKLFQEHRDAAIFDSLPGAGAKIAPRLLSELGDDRGRFDTPEALQCIAGSAPVTKQSGRMRWVQSRRACNKTLRATVHHFAHCSRSGCAWAEAYYQRKRAEGKTHACALRCLAQRWLRIIWKMWQTRTPYDEARHACDQRRHGSFVAAPPSAAVAAT